MRQFIIIRGPPGIGKSKISEHLISKLGGTKAHYFSLDQQEEFDQNIQTALTRDLTVGEMFFGDSHTTRPEQWLSKFNDYCKVSFILYASFDTCYKRARTRPEYSDYSEEQYKELYYGFKFLCLFNVFNQYAKVREIWINTEHRDPSNIAEEIADMFLEICGQS
jgi:broad-specificity NMP kinase